MTNAVNIAQSGSNNQTFRNKLINGAMVIDQRLGGTSYTVVGDVYTLDRWKVFQTAASKFSVQQNAGSVTPPAGFTNYLGVTSLSSYSVSSGDYFLINQNIEGFNIADLGFGTANAQPVTLSFWVRSSLTGTFGGAILNENFNRTYPFTYTISLANTWTKVEVTAPGETTGTWFTNNAGGMQVRFVMGCGSARLAPTPNAWNNIGYDGPTGSTSVVGTNGATWYVTGVQLEKGTAASPFENRLYGTELQLCQRYFQTIQNTGAGTGTAAQDGGFIQLAAFDANSAYGGMVFQQTMRASPSINLSDTPGNTINLFWNGTAGDCDGFNVNNTSTSRAELQFSATINFTAGNAVWARIKTNKAVLISAEL